MESNGNCKIEHSESTTRKQRTEGSVFLLQPFGNSQQYSSRQETKHGTEGFINPVFINGILYKETYTDYKYKDTNLPKRFSPMNFSSSPVSFVSEQSGQPEQPE